MAPPYLSRKLKDWTDCSYCIVIGNTFSMLWIQSSLEIWIRVIVRLVSGGVLVRHPAQGSLQIGCGYWGSNPVPNTPRLSSGEWAPSPACGHGRRSWCGCQTPDVWCTACRTVHSRSWLSGPPEPWLWLSPSPPGPIGWQTTSWVSVAEVEMNHRKCVTDFIPFHWCILQQWNYTWSIVWITP